MHHKNLKVEEEWVQLLEGVNVLANASMQAQRELRRLPQ
jgi:hypothetical protein